MKILFFFLINIAIIFSQSLLNPTNQIIQNFENKLDTNIYFHFYHKKLSTINNSCNVADGPYCRFLNKKSFIQNNANKEAKKLLNDNIIERILETINQLESDKKENPNLQYYVAPDTLRKYLDKEILTEKDKNEIEKIVKKKNEKIFDFEIIQIFDFGYELANTLQLNIEDSTFSIVQVPEKSSKKINIYFDKIFVPIKKKVKKNSFQDDLMPSDIFLYTEEKKGVMTFSQPVVFRYIYVRKHDFNKYYNYVIENKKTFFEYSVNVYLEKELQFKLETRSPISTTSKWVKLEITGNDESLLFDRLEFEPNTDFDNLKVEIYESKSLNKKINIDTKNLMDVFDILVRQINTKIKELNKEKKDIKEKKDTNKKENEKTEKLELDIEMLLKELESQTKNKENLKNQFLEIRQFYLNENKKKEDKNKEKKNNYINY